ncbi:beta-carotene isomerase D27-like protein [Tasmannia lanceolata]|uniref:beta-carotene isomerase D27-like protein n=1 Tax=Tasmannia lanceolata TaxID=3420 RepID=UPI004063ECCE
MEAKLLLNHGGLSSITPGRKLTHKPKCSPVVLSVMTKPRKDLPRLTETSTVYNDNWFDLMAIRHLSQSVQAATGIMNNKEGYESLIEAATVVARNFNPNKQQDLVIEALDKAFPKPILLMMRSLLWPSKFTREFFAIFTTFFFPWLMGPCEAKESELGGSTERNVVHIKKCRFLEGTNCVGMCINLCKMPSQKFIYDSFGIPVNMVPNFEDMSCDMIFGQHPPPATEDPALKQPCYKLLCKAKQKHSMECSSS